MKFSTPHENRFAQWLAGILLASIAGMSQAQNSDPVAEGKKAFVACAACHSIDGSKKITGPTLKAIVGRSAASDKNYGRYSQALRDSKIVWTTAELDVFMKAPAQRVKGTTMVVSVADAKKRAAIVAYLGTIK